MTRKLTPLKAIKKKCKEDCCAGDTKSWVDCKIKDCALWPYRFGKNPYHTKTRTSKQQESTKRLQELKGKSPKTPIVAEG